MVCTCTSAPVSFLSCLGVFVWCVKSVSAVVVSVQNMMSLNYLEVSPFRCEGPQPSDED